MKNTIVIVALLVAAVPARAGGLKITYAGPKQGEVKTIVNDEALDGTVSVGKNTAPLAQKESASLTEETLAVDGGVVTKAKVVVTDAERDGQAMPTKGKTYVLAASGGAVTVTADGKEVADPELTMARRLVDDVGEADKFLELMGKKTFTKGQKVTLAPDEVASMFSQAEGLNVTKASLTLTAQNAGVATFALTGVLAGNQEGLDVTMDVTASIKLEIASGRPLDYAISGTVNGKGDAQGQKVAMKAKLTAHKAMTYR